MRLGGKNVAGRRWVGIEMKVALWLIAVVPAALAQKNFDQPPQFDPAPPASPQGEASARFLLINNSRQTIDNLNISPVEADSWGDDLFGVLALPPGNRIIAGPAQDGCLFDVRVVYHDHREEVLQRQNLCDLQELAFTGRNARSPHRRADRN